MHYYIKDARAAAVDQLFEVFERDGRYILTRHPIPQKPDRAGLSLTGPDAGWSLVEKVCAVHGINLQD